ncbi:methyltransferase domain-containing protein [Roseobacter sp.]|uniref:class I SAM-dependent DNA methyltransferase n=1 Tax=Roseobacter sp. TaxID=1907202 RepID=UPI003298A4AD
MEQGYLGTACDTCDAEGTGAHDGDWLADYDAQMHKHGYATPSRCAQAACEFITDHTQSVLDFGCGTGLSGMALRSAGFTAIDGVDLSPDMLARAETKQVYRNLSSVGPKGPLPRQLAGYSLITAIDVIGTDTAPISVFDALMQGMTKGTVLVLSLNDHALADPANEARINEWLDCGAARLLFRESGPHMPGIGLNSNVYVFEKN